MTDTKTTTNLMVPDGRWFAATTPLPAHYCVVCQRLITGTDYLWRAKLNGMLTDYIHPACLKAKP